jgi:dynein heavy chain
MVAGIKPDDAAERLRRYKENYEIMERTFKINKSGEELFGLPHTDYPDLEKTDKELVLLDKLYSL